MGHQNGGTIFQQMLIRTSNKIDGVVGRERRDRERGRRDPEG